LKISNAKIGKISACQLFFIFLVSRAVVALTFYQGILYNGISPDSLLSSAGALLINLLFCFPAFLCCKYDKNPKNSGFFSLLYCIYFVFFAGVNIARFAFFAAEKTTSSSNVILFVILMAAAGCYAAFLKIEAISRFSVICAVVSILVLIAIILLNIRNFEWYNFLPFFVGSRSEIMKNSVIFSSNSVEPALYLALYDKCEKKQAQSLFWGIGASYGAIFLMLLFCIGVMGSAAPLFSYPVYTLFQMTAFGSFSRLDIVYTAFGFFALFAKCAVLILCAEESAQKIKINRKVKLTAVFFIISALSYFIYRRFFTGIITSARGFYFALSAVFSLLLPLIYLIFTKRKKPDEKSL